jgi:Uma2 family endonuclease
LLVIEVSDSTLRYDSTIKVPLYARLGVPEVWIVDLQNTRLLIFESPADGRYASERTESSLGRTTIGALPGVEIDLSRLLEG